MSTYRVVGLMSGTSMDGLDIALCSFIEKAGKWNYSIEQATTVPYPPEWQEKLTQAANLDGRSLLLLHKEYGSWLAGRVTTFLQGLAMPDLIASHGHTVFHQPEKGLTFQLGDGDMLTSGCNITAITDFRSRDVAQGGEGAPLVPVGDELLFGSYDYCLNLGGFANISYRHEGKRLAFDLCPVNIVLNHYASEQGLAFDKDGIMGSGGRVDIPVLNALNQLDYYQKTGPKSLGREWVETSFLPVFEKAGLNTQDKLRTVYAHIGFQTQRFFSSAPAGKVLVTGGGAHNAFLMECLRHESNDLVVPDKMVVDYKEALVFAFLGLLRYLNRTNCLASVTGGRKDISSGTIHPA